MYHMKEKKPPVLAKVSEGLSEGFSGEPSSGVSGEPSNGFSGEPSSGVSEDSLENSSYYTIPNESEGSYLSKQMKTNYFIDLTDILMKTDDVDISTKPLQVCIYKVSTHAVAPYLLYLMEYNPSTSTYQWAQPLSQEMSESTTLSQKIVAQYPFLTDDEDITIGTIDDERYKGFYDNDDSIVAVYDTTTFKKDLLEENENFLWVSHYEILFSQKVYNIPVDPAVIAFFMNMYDKYQYDFYHLKKEGTTDEYIKSPYVLYLCKTGSSVSGTYENIGKLGEETRIFYPRVDHKKLDRFFLFSSNLLNPGSHEENLKMMRFAVFVDNDPSLSILYIDGPDEGDLEHLYDGTLGEEYTIATFIENEQQYWSVQNPAIFSPIE